MFKLNLQRFAESGVSSQAAAGSTGDASQAAAGSGARTGQAAAGNAETRQSWEEIKEAYKDDYQKEMTKVIRQRFASAKENETKLSKIAPIMNALASKYGTSPDDIDSIAKYIDEDESLYEDAAYQAGMTVEQYKRYSQMKAENDRLKAEQALIEQRKNAQEIYARWQQEAEEIQATYPNFDLDTYLNDEHFQALLRNGVPLKQAYIAMDADNIIPGVMGYTAQQVERKTADTIAQRGSRPKEGGMSGRSAAKTGANVSALSNAEIADLVRRASAGERISF